MHLAKSLALAGVLSILLVACSTAPPVPEHLRQAYWREHQDMLAAFPTWTVNGSISTETSDDDWSARVNWKHTPDRYKLRIYGPLGQGAAVLRGDANSVVLRDADGKTFAARDPQTLMRQHFAVDLPVASLRYWVRGLPTPEFPVLDTALNNQGRLAMLQQADWHITYPRYRKYNNRLLPREIMLKSREYQIEIVVSKWTLESSSPPDQTHQIN